MPTPDWPTTTEALDGTRGCALGCTTHNQHRPGCPCHDQCPTHDDHCTGCAPRPTRGHSLLCGPCYYHRLRRPLREIPVLHDWLGARMYGLKANDYDRTNVAGSKEAPLPFNADMYDLRAVMTLLTTGWADRAIREADPGPGLTEQDVAHACGWLDKRAGWVAEQPWVPTLVWHLAELVTRSQQLAPWRPTHTRLGLPCPKCDRMTLALNGGDDWVSCDARDCDEIIGWFRYERLVKAIIDLRKVG